MTFDYFTPGDAEQYAYYSIPKMLIKGEQFRGISMEAKLLYGILLDRVSLSLKHGWVDENNHVYIIFTIEQIMEEMNCGNKKAVTLLNELEKKIHLVEKKRQGLGKPNLIYVKNFYQSVDQIYSSQENDENSELSTIPEEEIPEVSKQHFQKCQNDTSRNVHPTSQEMSKRHGTNTNNINTDISNPNPIVSYQDDGSDAMRASEYEKYHAYFCDALSIDNLKIDHPFEKDTIDGILDLLVDTCCSTKPVIRISGEDKPASVVKSRLMKLNFTHMDYVLKCMNENYTQIRNIRQYLLTTLYNAPSTISPFYRAWVNSDMASGALGGGGE
ncbi:MAG: replication initiator protein A [Lachnospiraceae bacterium]|nr:replication initiator protein A [Lachnospiraceae bacterium]